MAVIESPRITAALPAICLSVALALPAGADTTNQQRLAELADGDHRSEAYAARNPYRHPVETLMFFGIEPDMTVVEIAPGGGGWYTEIVSPFVRDNGRFYAANYDPVAEREYFRRNARRFVDKLAENLDLYGHTVVTVFAPPAKTDIAPSGSADMVLVFRNVHNWMDMGPDAPPAAFEAFYTALKPGGVLGVVQHRGDPGKPQDAKAESGYVREDVVIGFAEAAGFELTARSEINANAKDTKDHPNGVWTLPPNFNGDEQDRAKYAAIGESDRMTLKFVKPAR
jgi:predicted methyltransferase